MRFITIIVSLFLTCNVFAQISGTGPNNKGNVPLHNLRHSSGPEFVIRSGVGGKAEWIKDSIYFPKYFNVASAPLTAKKGDFWRSTANQNTYFWDGIDWRLLAKKDTLFASVDTTGLVTLIKNIAPIRKDTLFTTVDTTGLRNFVRNQASAIDKFSFLEDVSGIGKRIVLGDNQPLYLTNKQNSIGLTFDDIDNVNYLSFDEGDGIIGNENGRLRLSKDTLYYRPSSDSLESFYKLPKDSISWDSIKNKPLTFTPSTHTHTIPNITNLQDSLNARSRVGHGHVINDVAFLQDNLNLKSNVNHTHVIANVINLQDSLLSKAPINHTHPKDTIKRLANYSELRALNNYIHDIVVVNDWTYTGPDGNTYTTKGSLFKKISTGTENGGTIIVGNYIWARDWDGINGLVEWWECGGYDVDGNNYTSKNTSALGIYNESDRLNAAGRVISNIQLQANKNYLIDKTFKVQSETVSGNNATLSRITTPASLTTQTSNAGTNTVTVANASLYRAGHQIIFVNTGAANGGIAFDENTGLANPHIITNVNTGTNVITFTNNLVANVGIGWKVVLNITLLSLSSDSPNNGAVNIKNLNFDGNRTGNNHCYDWRFAGEFSASTTDTKVLIQNCHFKNSVVECINYGKLHVQDCSYENLGGSFIHVSSPTYLEALVVVNNTHGNRSNQIANTITGHSEATVTSSANTTHVRLTNCSFLDGGESILSFDSFDDYDLIFSNNHCKNYKYIFVGGGGGGIKVEKKITLNNNTFDNCGPIYMEAASPSSITKNTGISLINIANNTLINSSFIFNHVGQIAIRGNSFYWDNTKTPIYDYANNPLSAQDALNHIRNFDRVYIENNIFEHPIAYNANTQFALLLQHNNIVRKLSNGTDTEYLYPQDVKVNGNTFAGFKYSIATAYTFSPQYVNLIKQAVGWEYKNNIIYMSRSTGATNGVGIFVDPGVVCEGNTIYTNNTIASYAGIIAAGVGTSGSAHNRLIGAICNYNKIIGGSGSTAADIVANADGTRYNVTCIGNMTRDDVANATNGYFAGNYKLTTTNYPQLSGMTTPQWRYFGEDANQY